MVAQPALHIGTSGWIYKDWRGRFYPPGVPQHRWFSHYAGTFQTVEINNTFYRLPPPETFRAWRHGAPPGFVFSVKASRFMTHLKKLRDCEEPVARFLEGARELGPHLGPILYQLPPFWKCDADRLRDFVSLLPRDLRHVFEFREPSWYVDDVRAILEQAGVGFCFHDLKQKT